MKRSARRSKQWVFFFGDGSAEGFRLGKDVLGGKGAGLAEMSRLGLPVPPGFTISTDVCRIFLQSGGKPPKGLDGEVDRALARLESAMGLTLGDRSRPLLLSVRSGAPVSMPGMMDTILNLGLNDEAVEGLARTTGNRRFAYDSYRRLLQMYGEVVDGIDAHRFEQPLAELKQERKAKHDVDLSGDDLAELVETFKRIYEQETGDGFPQDARAQIGRASCRERV